MSPKEKDLQKVKDYIKDPQHPYISLVGLFNLSKGDKDKGAKIGDLAIVNIEGPNFRKAMTYLNENIWIIQYVDTEILIELKNKNYYGFGSSEVDEEIRKELNKRKDELPYWELSPQLESDSTPSVKKQSIQESSTTSTTTSGKRIKRKRNYDWIKC